MTREEKKKMNELITKLKERKNELYKLSVNGKKNIVVRQRARGKQEMIKVVLEQLETFI